MKFYRNCEKCFRIEQFLKGTTNVNHLDTIKSDNTDSGLSELLDLSVTPYRHSKLTILRGFQDFGISGFRDYLALEGED